MSGQRSHTRHSGQSSSSRRGSGRRSSGRRKNVRRSRRLVFIWIGVILAGVVGCAAWVGVRLVLSYTELHEAQRQAQTVIAAVSADPAAAVDSSTSNVDALAQRLDKARSLTGDPIWTAAEIVPFAGDNLRAYRLTVDSLATAVGDGLKPALPAIADLGSSVSLTDGRVDLDKVQASADTIDDAAMALRDSRTIIDGASDGAVVAPLAEGVTKATVVVDELSSTVSSLAIATKILPVAFGGDGAKHYGLLFNNNAELRTTGGIAGAISEITADAGTISLGDQLVPDDLNAASANAPETTRVESTLFGPQMTEFIQNVNITPDFARAGELTSDMWQRTRGSGLDGVLSIDTVTLARVLAVTGPVTVEGREITAENATQLLLSDIYREIPSRDAQDVFFAEVTRSVFDKVLHGGASPIALAKALNTASSEGRISLWFADPALQAGLKGSDVAGPTARLNDNGAPVGVFLVDDTRGKMDYYLRGSLAAATCESGGKQRITTTATLRSDAPADIVDAPWYVTGAGQSDTPVGSIRTMVQFASTESLQPERITVDGKPVALKWATIDDRRVAVTQIDLAPGASATVKADYVVRSGAAPTIDKIVATPTATPFEHTIERGRCG